MKNRLLLITLAAFIFGLLGPMNLPAEDAPDAAPAVARVSVVHGTVSTMHGDAGQWVAATVNSPLMAGDNLTTGASSNAEVQLDPANILRLDQNTQMQIAELSPNRIRVQLASGLVEVSVFRGTQADIEIDTPNMGVHPLTDGVFRVQVQSATETQLTVRRGESEVLTNQGSTKVEAGQIIYIHGADNPEYRVDQAPAPDDFDKWAFDRDRQITNAQAWQHTSPDYTGSSDLDTYGQWSEVPDYGWCWTPQVDLGWVPYSAGYWGWEPYWGYTWISYEPWGWAPYHYGRWFMYGGAWRWWPAVGAFGARAMWSPAYVSFFGLGGRGVGVGIGLGFGSIGWLALGPRDIFHPWFGAGRTFGALSFNDIHGAGFIRPGGPRFGSNLENMATDPHVRGAFRSVSSLDFASGRRSRSMPVSETMMRSASVMRGTLPVAHTQGSLGNRAGNFSSGRSAAASGMHFFSRGSAVTAGRTYEMTGRAGGGTASFGARSNPMTGGRTETGTTGARSWTYNWQRYSTSGRTPPTGSGSSTGFQGRSGPAARGTPSWERFATPSPYSSGRQGYTSQQSRTWSGGGWNAPAPRSGGSSYGGGRPALQLNRPLMRQRTDGGGNYGSGGRTYSKPSGGETSKPSGEGHVGGGGGGSHSGGGSHGGRR
jgi:hypothetical protein